MASDVAIADYSASVLLRYYRRGAAVEVDRPRLDVVRDREHLRRLWALSGRVRRLVTYVIEHRHEVQSMLSVRSRTDDAVARGRIDARETQMTRLRTGLSTTLVFDEPVRSFETGPNQVLSWVLSQARVQADRLVKFAVSDSPYATLAGDMLRAQQKMSRIDSIREALSSPRVGRRPSPAALRGAARSRRLLYRHAVDAYNLLVGVERGDHAALDEVVKSTLVSAHEPWRRFELAVALAVGEALEECTGSPMQLTLISDKQGDPIIRCGSFDIYWQQATTYFSEPALEPSEIVARSILTAYGLRAGSDRPDLVVVDRARDKVVSIIEVKYLEGDTGNARFREAIDQVVRYARGYATDASYQALLVRSLVVLSDDSPDSAAAGQHVPYAADFSGITRKALTSWASRLSP